jgi:hypothetical protein
MVKNTYGDDVAITLVLGLYIKFRTHINYNLLNENYRFNVYVPVVLNSLTLVKYGKQSLAEYLQLIHSTLTSGYRQVSIGLYFALHFAC